MPREPTKAQKNCGTESGSEITAGAEILPESKRLALDYGDPNGNGDHGRPVPPHKSGASSSKRIMRLR